MSQLSRCSLIGATGAAMLSSLFARGAFAWGSGSRPNLILFYPDEMHADALACHGNPVTRTPNFDRLARPGIAAFPI